MDEQRRKLLQGGAAVGAATALSGAASTAHAQAPGEVLFAHEGSFIPVLGANQRFQVRRIYCVGRNYAAHSREMGSDPTREPPFFFQKPTDAIQFVAPSKCMMFRSCRSDASRSANLTCLSTTAWNSS